MYLGLEFGSFNTSILRVVGCTQIVAGN